MIDLFGRTITDETASQKETGQRMTKSAAFECMRLLQKAYEENDQDQPAEVLEVALLSLAREIVAERYAENRNRPPMEAYRLAADCMRIEDENKILLDNLVQMVDQACAENDGVYDSGALTAYSNAFRVLVEAGRAEYVGSGYHRQWSIRLVPQEGRNVV